MTDPEEPTEPRAKDSRWCADVARALRPWYRKNGRSLPWRETHDPYRIWVSEIMLQQTQVTTVLPYYRRFTSKYEELSDLAEAEDDDVMALWEGLGYYARARNLLRAARDVVSRYSGTFPRRFDDIQALPGIGRSTAGAIACFAYGHRTAVLDANVRRVLVRLAAIEGDPTRAAPVRALWQHAQTLVNAADDPYDHNQGMMELGALVCQPRRPRCLLCPLRQHCRAYSEGLTEVLPARRQRRKRPHRTFVAAVIAASDRVLLRRRPEHGLLGGLWGFPDIEHAGDEAPAESALRAVPAGVSVDPNPMVEPLRVKHAFTHFEMTLDAVHFIHREGQPTAQLQWAWIRTGELDGVGLSKVDRHIANTLQGGPR